MLPAGADVPGIRLVSMQARRAGRVQAVHDQVAEEVPVALEYNGISHAVMLATPHALEDFALGFSLTEAIIASLADVRDIEVTHEPQYQGVTVQMEISPACFMRLKKHRRTLAGRTGCGLCGTESLPQAVRPPPVLAHRARFEADAVLRAAATLREHQPLHTATGATHAAGWAAADGMLTLVREDVGRHNALDKLAGALLRAPCDAAHGFIVVTSRASYEMVAKTAHAGCGLLAAVSGVTGLAIDVAEAANLTLLGFARGGDLNVYSHTERVVFA